MASNINIKVTADLVDLQTNFTAAQVRVQMLTSELKNLEKQAQTAGGASDELKAKIAGVSQQLLNAKGDVNDFGAQLKEHTGSSKAFAGSLGLVGEAAGALGIALSAESVIGFGKDAVEFAAEAQHMADVLGISTTELQAFQFAARQSGVSVDDADVLLRRFMANMGALQENTGPAVAAVKDLGLTADELSGPPTVALQKIATALLAIQDPARRAHDEVEIFGRSGLDLNAMLSKLAQGFPAMAAEAAAAGQMMDPKLTKAAEDADNQLAGLWASIEGTGAEAFVGLGQDIQGVIDWFHQFGAAADQGEIAARRFAMGVKDAFTQMVQAKLRIPATAGGLPLDLAKPQMPDAGAAPDIDIEKKRSGPAAVYGVDPDMMEQVRAEMDQLRQMDQSDSDTSQRLAQLGFDQKKQIWGEEVAQGKITKQQELTDLIGAANDEKNIKLQALNQEIANNATNLTLVNNLENQKKIIVAQTEAEIAALRRQIAQTSADEDVEIKKRELAEISSAEETLVSKIMGGRTTMWGALVAAGQQFVEKEIEQDLKGLTAHLLLNQQELAADKAAGQMGVLWDAASEALKTNSTAAGVAARSGIQQAATAADNTNFLLRAVKWVASELGMTTATTAGAAERASADITSQVTAAAAQKLILVELAGAGGVASWAAAPWPIDLGAPAFGAAMAAAAASFDVGTNFVPKTMPAIVHAGERIIPAADNRALMAALSGGGSGLHVGQIGPFTHSGGGGWSAEDHAKDIMRVIKNQVRLGAHR